MTTLLVASSGGHLEQLTRLVPRLGLDGDFIWVTYDTLHARSLLEGRKFIPAHHPTTKHVPNAIRNTALARRVFSDSPIDRVVSTGAAVAVPFIGQATVRRIPSYYIESATRIKGPSLTGRLLQLLPRSVHLYRQAGSWGEPRWRQGPSVFDGFSVSRRDTRDPRRVLVSLGTHGFPFSRLLHRLVALLEAGSLEVTWQLGSTRPPQGLPGRAVRTLGSREFAQLVRSTDVLIGHAGTGLSLTALSHGKVPVLVPRQRRHGEHTDDHQGEIARELRDRGLAVTAHPQTLSWEHLKEAASLVAVHRDPPPFPLWD